MKFLEKFEDFFYFINYCQPKSMICRVIIASPTSVTFNEWNSSEFFKARAGRLEILAGTFGASGGMHNEAESGIQWAPAAWAIWNFLNSNSNSNLQNQQNKKQPKS